MDRAGEVFDGKRAARQRMIVPYHADIVVGLQRARLEAIGQAWEHADSSVQFSCQKVVGRGEVGVMVKLKLAEWRLRGDPLHDLLQGQVRLRHQHSTRAEVIEAVHYRVIAARPASRRRLIPETSRALSDTR